MQNSIERARLLRDIRHLCDEPIDLVPGRAPASAARRGMVERAKAAASSAEGVKEAQLERTHSGELVCFDIVCIYVCWWYICVLVV